MILHRILQILTGVLLGLAVVAVVFLFAPSHGDELAPWAGAGAHPDPYPAPELSLTATDGERVTLEDLRGRTVLVFFGFANCPDVCPVTLARWSRALELVQDRGQGFQGVFVSVDPARDTPETLDRWMEAFHPSILALTGSPEDVAATAEAWNVHVRVTSGGEDPHAHHGDDAGSGESSEYMVEHSSRTFVVNPEGRVVRTFPPYLDPDEIVELIGPFLNPG